MGHIFRTIFSQKYLFYTNSLGSGLLMCLGDTIQQSVEHYTKEDKSGYDLKRISHMGTIGLFMGPPQHYFYKYLDRFLPKTSIKSIAFKICLDQAIISPVCITIFLGGLGLLERKSYEAIEKEIREKFLLIYTTDCLLWPPCQYVNFAYVNPKYRVMYMNVISVVYDTILSYIKYGEPSIGENTIIHQRPHKFEEDKKATTDDKDTTDETELKEKTFGPKDDRSKLKPETRVNDYKGDENKLEDKTHGANGNK